MLRPTESWTTQQLAEFLAVVSSFADEDSALRGGVDRAAEALDAEVAALVESGRVLSSIGFPTGREPVAEILAACESRDGRADLPGVGACEVITATVDEEDSRLLIVARAEMDGYTQEEADLLRGMGRVLGLALRSIHLVTSLNERQVLLERLSKLQRSIASRAALDEVFEATVEGAHELLGDETVGLRLLSPDDPGRLEMVASRGIDPEHLPAMRHSSIEDGAGGKAVREGALIVVEDYGVASRMVPEMVDEGIRAALAAPVFQRGEVVGSLVVATRRAGRKYSVVEREALQAFAEHAGLALNDAKAAEETAHQAFHDALTGLPNRALFLDRLRVARDRAERNRTSVGVLFADLDGFKTVNDSLGHPAGDELLVMVAQRLSGTLRASTVARFGGDEFAILIDEVAAPIDAARVAQRVLEVLGPPLEVLGRTVRVTASIGIAVGIEPPDELMRNADLAMYEAKGLGKGRYELFQRDMHRAMTDRLDLEEQLAEATRDGDLVLHYQPIVELASGEVHGVEALVRWLHPDRGLVPPGEFIPVAEEGGQIHELGRWVLRTACRQAATWQSDHGPIQIAVNLSTAQLSQPSLVREVREILEETSLDPGSLTLEITETVLMDATSSNIERLEALKDLGVRFAVDDFGTGYSSLQYLRRFPIDTLKVAKPFVDGVVNSDGEAGLARAIVDIASSLDLGVIAEGIESGRQSTRLVELGCGLGQGFYFSPPLPADEIESVLEDRAPFASRRSV